MQTTEATKAATKSPEAFRTISEASTELGVPQHVLRFWETKFSFIRPMKRAGGRRFYRPQDIAVLKGVRTLLHESGYTIKGVQRLHREHGTRLLVGAGEGDIPPPAASLQEPEPSDRPTPQAPERKTEAPVVEKPTVAERPRRAPPAADSAILKGDARSRLDAVLRDIEQAKTAIDELLAHGED